MLFFSRYAKEYALISSLFKQPSVAVFLTPFFGVLWAVSSPAFAVDADGSLLPAGGVSEPVAVASTLTTAGSAVDLFDFLLLDGGSGDGEPLDVSEVALNTSGTATAAQWGKVTWRLNGPDASDVIGVYSAGNNTLTFSGLSISVADAGSETYIVSAFFNANTGLTDGATFALSVDGNSDLVVSAAGTQMGTTTAVTNGTGSAIEVVATELVYTTAPAGAVSGLALSTQPVVEAQDVAGNTDSDFSGSVALNVTGLGSVSNASEAAVNGVATFTNFIYSATADAEGFSVTAVSTGLISTAAVNVNSEVVATQLVFTAGPAGLTSGTALTTQPVVEAQNAQGIADTDFIGTVTITEASAGAVSNNTAAATAGVASFSGLTYTATVDKEPVVFTAGASGVLSASSATLQAEVVADRLVYTTAPAGSLSGTPLTTQPVVEAQDAAGVVDVDFTEQVIITDTGAGEVSNNVLTAVSGVAIFTNLIYIADNDKDPFELVADDDGALTATTSATLISEVVASQLFFFNPPSPTGIDNATLTPFTTVPEIHAVDATGTTDEDYVTPIVLSVVNGAGSYALSGVAADTDSTDQSVTLTMVAGEAVLTGLQLVYTASGVVNETFNLRAVSGGLTPVTSSDFLSIVDGTTPTLSAINRQSPASLVTHLDSVSWRFIFSEVVIGVDVSDFVISGTTATVSQLIAGFGGSQYDVTISGGDLASLNGTVSIALNAVNGISDPSANALTDINPQGANNNSFQIDNVAPAVSVGAPSLSATTTDPVSVTVTYTDADFITLSPGDITLNKVGTADGTVSVSGSGTATRLVTLSNISGNGSLGITVNAGTAEDAAGNMALASAASSTFSVNNPSPTFTVSTPSASATSTGPVSYTVNYTNASVISLNAAQVVLNKTGTADGDVSVTGSGLLSRTIVINNVSGTGTLGISLPVNTAQDVLANQAADFGPSATFIVDNTVPQVTSMARQSPISEFTSSDTLVWRVTFDSDVNNVDAADFSLSGTTASITNVSNAVGNNAYDITVTGGDLAALNAIASIGFSAGQNITDTLGQALVNTVATGINQTSYIVDNEAPTVALSLDKSSLTSLEEGTLTVEFSEPVEGFSIADITAENATLSNLALTSGSTKNYTATLTAAASISDNTNSVSIAAASYTDRAGNNGASGSSAHYEIVSSSENAINKIKEAADNDDASLVTIADINAVGGILDVVEANLVAYRLAIASALEGDVDSVSEIQSLIHSVNAVEKIKQAAASKNAENITFFDLNSVLGVTDAVSANEVEYHTFIVRASVSDVDTPAEVAGFVASVNAIEKIKASAQANDASNVVIDDVNAVLGVSGAIPANETGYQQQIASRSSDEVSTNERIKAIVNRVNGLAKIALYADANANAEPTVLDYLHIGIIGVTAADISDVNVLIDNVSSDDTDTFAEVRGVIGLSLLDSDADTVPDVRDVDDDNDGILDSLEDAGVSNLTGIDSNNNGIDDGVDAALLAGTDADSDGIVDDLALLDSDSDGVPNIIDLDSDNDGIADAVEYANNDADKNFNGKLDGLLDANNDGGHDFAESQPPRDTDGDGLADLIDLDSDGDGRGDFSETAAEEQIVKLDYDGDGRIDSETDIDRDGVIDVVDSVNLFSSVEGEKLTPQDADGDGVVEYRDAIFEEPVVPESEAPAAPVEKRKTAAMHGLFLFTLAWCCLLYKRRRISHVSGTL